MTISSEEKDGLKEVQDDLEQARKVVSITYDAKSKDRSGDKAKDPISIEGGTSFGDLISLSNKETQHLEGMRAIIARYLNQKGHEHPLCLAVFGPPGSGKSFAVKQIQEEIKRDSKIKLSRTTINLTQVSSSAELTEALSMALMAAAQEEGAVPLIFFDEFDTTRDGAAYGWLSTFLAPMQDGEFLHNGKNVKLQKAIYVFAGGTASTMEEFANYQSDVEFRRAKGPDFISRLRGYLDVAGPNQSPRMLRRAIILRSELQKRVMRHGTGEFEVEQDLIDAFLKAGRYRHGARSIVALVEHADLKAEKLSWDLLPDDHLVALQVDRGFLDERLIQGSIALSGFVPEGGGSMKAEAPDVDLISNCWRQVATALWDEGATLAFAGLWEDHHFGLVKSLLDELSSRPRELSREKESREVPSPRFRSFLKGFDPKESRAEVYKVLSKDPRFRNLSYEVIPNELKKMGVELVARRYLDDEEQDWGQNWQARTIERFRRRLAVSEASVARFTIGGDVEVGDEQRSGVVHEAIQSLALGRPIYLAGGFGGATYGLGVILGLSEFQTGTIPESMACHLGQNKQELLREMRNRLQPSSSIFLPVWPDEQIDFLRERGLGKPGWPDNGLSPAQNRELFRNNTPKRVVELTIEGLRHVFGGG